MTGQEDPESKNDPISILRRILPFTGVAIIIAALYVGWTFYSRANDARRADQAIANQKAADDKRTVDILGGRELKILQFYAVPGAIKRGDHATVCYGVNEAKNVRIDPPVEDVHPAMSHCLQVSPKKTTEYKLTADDGKGHTVTQSFVLQVLR